MRMEIPILAWLLICSSMSFRCSSVPRINGSAKTRTAASSAVRRRQFNFFAQVAGPLSSASAGVSLRVPALIELLLQGWPEIQIVLKQKLHRAFPRLTSRAMQDKHEG